MSRFNTVEVDLAYGRIIDKLRQLYQGIGKHPPVTVPPTAIKPWLYRVLDGRIDVHSAAVELMRDLQWEELNL